MTSRSNISNHLLPNDFFRGKQPVTPRVELLTCWRMQLHYWTHQNMQAPYWRLYRNNDDHARILWQDQPISLRPNQIYLIAPETPYRGELTGQCDHLFIHFLAPPPFDYCRNYIHEITETASMNQAVALITQSQNADAERISPPAAMAALCLVSSALITLPERFLIAPHPDSRLLPVMKLINDSPEKTHTNPALASLAGMSLNSFLRCFRRDYGMAPQQYILSERLRRACFLLQYSDFTIEEIAERTGFCDRFYFTRMFSRLRHISPAEFRKAGPTGIGQIGKEKA